MPDVENSSLEEMFVKLCKDKEMHEMVNTEPYLTTKYSLIRWCGAAAYTSTSCRRCWSLA